MNSSIMFKSIYTLVIAISFLLSSCCSTDDTRNNYFYVMNIGDSPVYVEISAVHIANPKDTFEKEIFLDTYEYWGYDSYSMTEVMFRNNYPIMKFVFKGCDENGKCNGIVLETIEMTQEQFFLMHYRLYYPLPEHDRVILEENRELRIES